MPRYLTDLLISLQTLRYLELMMPHRLLTMISILTPSFSLSILTTGTLAFEIYSNLQAVSSLLFKQPLTVSRIQVSLMYELVQMVISISASVVANPLTTEPNFPILIQSFQKMGSLKSYSRTWQMYLNQVFSLLETQARFSRLYWKASASRLWLMALSLQFMPDMFSNNVSSRACISSWSSSTFPHLTQLWQTMASTPTLHSSLLSFLALTSRCQNSPQPSLISSSHSSSNSSLVLADPSLLALLMSSNSGELRWPSMWASMALKLEVLMNLCQCSIWLKSRALLRVCFQSSMLNWRVLYAVSSTRLRMGCSSRLKVIVRPNAFFIEEVKLVHRSLLLPEKAFQDCRVLNYQKACSQVRKTNSLIQFAIIMSQVQIPKVADILQPELDNLKLVQLLVEGLEMRMEAEDAYEKALAKVSSKFNAVANSPSTNKDNKDDCYAVLVNEMSRIHSERSFQISHFKGQMKGDIAQLKDIAKNISTQLDGRLKEFKRIEKDFKVNAEKLEKSRWKSVHSHKELDERIILNEISKLNKDVSEEARKKLAENTTKLMAEQKEIVANYTSAIDIFASSIQSYNQSLPKVVEEVNKVVTKMRTEFFDIMKKYTIHEVSLVRNIQYDVDNAIRRIEKEELKEPKPVTAEKFPDYAEPKEEDGWDEARAQLINTVEKKTEMTPNQQFVAKFQKAVSGTEEDLKAFLQIINKDFVNLKEDLQKCVQSFRLVNKFKFEQNEYIHLAQLFKQMTQQAYNVKDMECLQKLLLFSITYYKMDKQKRYLFEDIKNFKFYNNLEFWRFYCYFSLRAVLNNYRRNAQISAAQNLLHEKNSVYSTLLTCANNMIQFGIEKHSIKNFIAKAAKSFPLTQFQISEILKFIENQFNAYEMKKPKEPELTKIVKIGQSKNV